MPNDLRPAIRTFRRDVVAAARRQANRELGPLAVAPAARQATVNFGFGGGGQPIAVAIDPITLLSVPTFLDPYVVEIPYPAQIVWAHLYAGDSQGNPVIVSATVDVQLTQFATFGGLRPLYGTGTLPTLTAQPSADLSLVGWQPNLVTGDTLIARLATFTGQASWVALIILLRPTEVPLGATSYTNGAAAAYTDASGNTYSYRS